jgi:hypothetical protein
MPHRNELWDDLEWIKAIGYKNWMKDIDQAHRYVDKEHKKGNVIITEISTGKSQKTGGNG